MILSINLSSDQLEKCCLKGMSRVLKLELKGLEKNKTGGTSGLEKLFFIQLKQHQKLLLMDEETNQTKIEMKEYDYRFKVLKGSEREKKNLEEREHKQHW